MNLFTEMIFLVKYIDNRHMMHYATKHTKKLKNRNKANGHKFQCNNTEIATVHGYETEKILPVWLETYTPNKLKPKLKGKFWKLKTA